MQDCPGGDAQEVEHLLGISPFSGRADHNLELVAEVLACPKLHGGAVQLSIEQTESTSERPGAPSFEFTPLLW